MDAQTPRHVVQRFNAEVIQEGNRVSFEQLVAPGFVNRSPPPGSPDNAESLWNTFQNILRPGLSNLRVTIHDQVAEDDKVTTRKSITGVHSGELMGIAPTGRLVTIDVIDIVRVENGRYVEHWGISSLAGVLALLRTSWPAGHSGAVVRRRSARSAVAIAFRSDAVACFCSPAAIQ